MVTARLVRRAGPQRDPELADPYNTKRLAQLVHHLLASLPSAIGQSGRAALGRLLGRGGGVLIFLEKLGLRATMLLQESTKLQE